MNDKAEVVEAEAVDVEPSQSNENKPSQFSEIRPEPLNFSDDEVEMMKESFDLEAEVKAHPTKSFKCDKCGQYHDALYVPWNQLAKRLNETFGVGQWQLVRASQPGYDGETNVVSYDGILFIRGKYAGDATGSISWKPDSHMDKGDAIEAAKSSCLTRCCKTIMPGLLELWDEQTSLDYYHGNRGNKGNTQGNSKQKGESSQKGRGNQQEPDYSRYRREDGKIVRSPDNGDDALWKRLNGVLGDWADEIGMEPDAFREDFKVWLWDVKDLEGEPGWSNLTPKRVDKLLSNMEKAIEVYKQDRNL